MAASDENPRRKLLLGDDSATIRKVVELTFADEGVDVISTANGEEAMEKFIEHTPDIVLVDTQMPGLSGYQLCEMIKGDASTRHIPVLLLVGSFEPFDTTEAEKVKADGFLMKPFQSVRELVAKVHELLNDETETLTPGAETEDIDELYHSSFAETVPIDEGLTEEALAQASFATGNADNAGLRSAGTEDSADILDAQAFDDELVETIRFADPDSENDYARTASLETKVDPFSETAVESAIHDSRADTVEIPSPLAESAAEAPSNMISPEVIDMIVRQVVERLSDRVIRDIAKDAVPRITERLIREALEEDRKN